MSPTTVTKPKPKMQKTTVDIPVELYKKAKARRISFSTATIKGINDILEQGRTEKQLRRIEENQAIIIGLLRQHHAIKTPMKC